jgi:hypothetical protein
MGNKERHTNESESLKKRLDKSYKDKDKGGAGVPAFDWKKAGEVKFYKPKEGNNKINIIPYVIKSKNHPLVRSGDMKVGDQDYLFDAFVHRYVGGGQIDIICPKRNFNKPCPICEQGDKFRAEGKDEEMGQMKPKRMVYYNVVDLKNPDEGIQVFAVSHFLFEKELIDEARNSADGGEIIDFPDINEGKEVHFRASTKTFNKQDFLEFKSFKFIDRDEAVDDDIVEKAISFDQYMKLYTYEEIEAILYGSDDDSGDDSSDDDSGDEADEESDEEGEDDEEEGEEDEEESEDSGDDEEEEEGEDDEEEGEDEEDEDDDDEPAPKPGKKVTIGKKPEPKKDSVKGKASKKEEAKPVAKKCPKGLVFGRDCNKKKFCEKCPQWNACLKEQNRLKRAGKGK